MYYYFELSVKTHKDAQTNKSTCICFYATFYLKNHLFLTYFYHIFKALFQQNFYAESTLNFEIETTLHF